MEYACEWVRKNLGEATPSEPYPCEWVKEHWDDESKQKPYPCEALEQYFETQKLIVTVSPATGTYWGTPTTDMQSDIEVVDDKFTGTLKYLDSGELVTTWGAGNFIALKFEVPDVATSCKVGLEPSRGSGLVELDEDKDGVFKVSDKDGQKFVVVTTDGEYTLTQKFDMSELVCETEE